MEIKKLPYDFCVDPKTGNYYVVAFDVIKKTDVAAKVDIRRKETTTDFIIVK